MAEERDLNNRETQKSLSIHRKASLGFKKCKSLLLHSSAGVLIAIPGMQISDDGPTADAYRLASLALLPAVLTGAGVALVNGRSFQREQNKQTEILVAAGIIPPKTKDGSFTSPDGTRFLPPVDGRRKWTVDISQRDMSLVKTR